MIRTHSPILISSSARRVNTNCQICSISVINTNDFGSTRNTHTHTHTHTNTLTDIRNPLTDLIDDS